MGLLLSPADLPDQGIEPGSPASQADSLPTELSGKKLSIVIVLLLNHSQHTVISLSPEPHLQWKTVL